MVRKNKSPIFRNYLASARDNKKEWEDHLNNTYPLESMTIRLKVEEDFIGFVIGKKILKQDRVQFNQLSAPDFYYTNNDNFNNIINSIFDLSKLRARTDFKDSVLIEAMPNHVILLKEKKLYRDFKGESLKETGGPCIWELYHRDKDNRYGFLGFNAGAIKFIKDPKLIEFATNDLINREHPIIDKIKAEEGKVKKAKSIIKKQEEVIKKANKRQKDLLNKL